MVWRSVRVVACWRRLTATGRYFLWDVASGALTGALADPSSRGVNGVAFAPAGNLLAAADGNGRTYLWKMR